MKLWRKIVAAATIAVLGAMALAATAIATKTPTGEYAPFLECQFENVEVEGCLYALANEGTVKIGEKSIPVVNPITLQGGFSGEPPSTVFFQADNGITLSKTPQPVPGGLSGQTAPGSWPPKVQELFNKGIEEGFTGVQMTMELAKPASAIGLNLENMLFEEGTALSLPVKFHLENALLGNNCYIGSGTEPVQLNLTTGTSGALEGTPGELSFNPEFTIVRLNPLMLVDGAFTAPSADGCGGLFSEFFDPFVDSLFGLPSASEENEVSLTMEFEIATAESVLAHSMW